MNLHSRCLDAPVGQSISPFTSPSAHSRPPVILLHGLFGSGNNLGALARHLQSDYQVCMLDLPSHGRSSWLEELSIRAMSDAVINWLEDRQYDCVHVLGHSLGGKVAMDIAQLKPSLVQSLVVADIAPVAYPHRHQSVFAALNAVAAAHCDSRDSARAVMAKHLREEQVISFLLTSLTRGSEGVMEWRFDREGLERGYEHLIAAPASKAQYNGRVMFIKGADSDYILEEHWPTIETLFPQSEIKILADCGHWLHAQKPQLFNATVSRFLKQGD
ncbi:MAG: alpha/beta fold hydrolase [Halioglobus sp.]